MLIHVLSIPSWYSHSNAPLLGSFFREQAEALTERGIKVGIIAARFFDLPSNDWLRGKSQKITHSVEGPLNVVRAAQRMWQPGPFHRIPMIYQASVRQREKLGLKMYDSYVAKYGIPNIIHGHSALWGGVLASAIADKHEIPVIITEHSSVIPRKIAGPRERKTAQRVYHMAGKNYSVSESLVTDLKSILNLQGIDFEITPHMVDSKFEFVEPTSSEECFNWLTVGNLVDDKGHDTLLRAFSKLDGPKSKLTFIGGGPHLESLQSLAQSLGVSEKVEFKGEISREDIPKEFSNCHALIHPSRYETQGIVIIEALATGRPVISTKCGGPNQVIKEDDGYLIPIDNEAAMTNAMTELMWKTWDGKSISERVINRFSKRIIIDQLEEIYTSIHS